MGVLYEIKAISANLGLGFGLSLAKGGEAIVNSKLFAKDHLGLDIIINQSVSTITMYGQIRNQRI